MHPNLTKQLRHRRAMIAKGKPTPSVADELAAALAKTLSWSQTYVTMNGLSREGPCASDNREAAALLVRYEAERKGRK